MEFLLFLYFSQREIIDRCKVFVSRKWQIRRVFKLRFYLATLDRFILFLLEIDAEQRIFSDSNHFS